MTNAVNIYRFDAVNISIFIANVRDMCELWNLKTFHANSWPWIQQKLTWNFHFPNQLETWSDVNLHNCYQFTVRRPIPSFEASSFVEFRESRTHKKKVISMRKKKFFSTRATQSRLARRSFSLIVVLWTSKSFHTFFILFLLIFVCLLPLRK